jgi:hypothetical protein
LFLDAKSQSITVEKIYFKLSSEKGSTYKTLKCLIYLEDIEEKTRCNII